jgi:hypothetical protein
LGDKEGDEHLRRKSSAPGEILIWIYKIRGNVGCGIEKGILGHGFDLVKKHDISLLRLE